MMLPIRKPVDRELLERELTPEVFVRKTNNANNDIYIFSAKTSPNLMEEVGRLREMAFRNAGGGTGKEVDIDSYDLDDKNAYKQLIVWNPEDKEIVGGYRYLDGSRLVYEKDIKEVKLATSGLFDFSDNFLYNYLPYTIELGRSFVQPFYQPTENSRKGIYSLDNLWDGLGALMVDNPHIQYFFGKVTMYTTHDKFSRDLILYFFKKHFPDQEHLVYPKESLSYHHPEEQLKEVLTAHTYAEDYRLLSLHVRGRGSFVPPLINAYMSLSATMKSFGTATNFHFGEVEETGILLTIKDLYDAKTERHTKSYKQTK